MTGVVINTHKVHPAEFCFETQQFEPGFFEESFHMAETEEVKSVGHELEPPLEESSPVVEVVEVEDEKTTWLEPVCKLRERLKWIVEVAVASPGG